MCNAVSFPSDFYGFKKKGKKMKTLAVAIAAIIATTAALPAQAAEEAFGVAFAAPIVKDALRQVAPGNSITLRLTVRGRAATLVIAGPGGWQQDAREVAGEFTSLPFAVTNRTPAGQLTFRVKATNASGQTIEDEITFLNVGPSQVAPAPTDSTTTSTPTSHQIASANTAQVATAPTTSPLPSIQQQEVRQVRHSAQWISPQIDSRGTQSMSSATGTTVWSLTGTPVRFGAQLRLAPMDSTAQNNNGKDGLEPFLGLGGQILSGWDVEGSLGLTANPWSGGLASWPLQVTLRSEASLPFGFRNETEAHTDFGSVGGHARLSWALDSSDGMSFGPFGELAAQKDIGQYYGRTVARAGVEQKFRIPSGQQARLSLGYSWAHNDWSNGVVIGLEIRPR